ncbi:hypothetical protein MCUN1_001546 [Malassezia cuniculi]|uniref:Dipeptidyl-peptidase V n=1 Tax=Malassezia cuniculi TaxID=948313 RepID=A0AAF0EXV6_9BASI|nr:hypothetical protein MCUN1_001546 [Malassezia cuniculi]
MRRPSSILPIAALVATAAADAGQHVLTPELLVSAPRPGAAIFNPSGTHAIVPVGYPDLETGQVSSALHHLDIGAGDAWDARSQPAEFAKASTGVFLNDRDFAYLNDTSLYVKRIGDDQSREIVKFPTSVSNLKSFATDEYTTLVFTADVYDDSDLDAVPKHSKSAKAKEWKRARTYDSGFARHWDVWTPLTRSQIFAVNLTNENYERDGDWFAVQNSTEHETPVGPLGDASDFDAKHNLVVYTTKTGANVTWHTQQDVFAVRLDTGEQFKCTQTTRGWSGAPAIVDSDTIFFLQQHRDGYESDRKRLQSFEISTGKQTEHLSDWDVSPSAITVARNGSLYLTAEQDAQERVFFVNVKRTDDGISVDQPVPVIHTGGTTNVKEAKSGALLYTSSSMHHPNDVFSLTDKTSRLTNFFRWSSSHADIDLGAEPKRFEYPGSDEVTAYGWLLTPPGFDESKQYPLAVLIHGGPEGAWVNSWSSRWNPAVFAAQGFVVATIDPSGSTGYGSEYTERILLHWGDRPYEDIVRGVHHVLKNEQYVDSSRVVAAGASFGGYMINWIAGHNDDGLFKALVTHDGVFDTTATWFGTDELYFPEAEFGGKPWEANTTYAEFSPSKYAHKWTTPHLIVHGGLDYRLDVSQAMSAWNTLQRLGTPSRLLYFPDEGHWVLNPLNSLKWHHEVLGWLKKYSTGAQDSSDAQDEQQSSVAKTEQLTTLIIQNQN